MQNRRQRTAPLAGTRVVWPSGAQQRYGISATTLWRWEKNGRLPPRDFNLRGKTGWKPATLDSAEDVTPAATVELPRGGRGRRTKARAANAKRRRRARAAAQV
jgi:hypothetical protein